MAQNSGLAFQQASDFLQKSGQNGFSLDVSLMVPTLQSRDRMGAIKELIDRLYRSGRVTDSLRFLQAVLDREDQESTALGEGVALPHARCRSVAHLSLALGISRPGIVFPLDDRVEPVHVVCMLAVPEAVPAHYLSLLGHLAYCFQHPPFRAGLIACTTPHQMHQYLSQRFLQFQDGPTGPLSCA